MKSKRILFVFHLLVVYLRLSFLENDSNKQMILSSRLWHNDTVPELRCKSVRWLQLNEMSHKVAKLKAVIKDRESAFPEGQVDATDQELCSLRTQLLAGKQEYKNCTTRSVHSASIRPGVHLPGSGPHSAWCRVWSVKQAHECLLDPRAELCTLSYCLLSWSVLVTHWKQ
jgi:hypothetical protein